MTVPITGSVKDVTGVEDNDTPWSFASVIRFADDGSVITEKPREVRAVSGNLKVNLVPGYAIVTYGKQVWQVTVPETATTLKALIEAGVAFPPDTSQALLDAAVGQYVETHREQFRTRAVPITTGPDAGKVQWYDENGLEVGGPVTWDQVIPTEVAQAAVEAEAPAAVGQAAADMNPVPVPGPTPGKIAISFNGTTGDEFNPLPASWVELPDKPDLYVEEFAAPGFVWGVDDTQPWQDAIDAASSEDGVVRIHAQPGRTYKINPLKVFSNTVIDLHGATVQLITRVGGSNVWDAMIYTAGCDPDNGCTGDGTTQVDNVEILNGILDAESKCYVTVKAQNATAVAVRSCSLPSNGIRQGIQFGYNTDSCVAERNRIVSTLDSPYGTVTNAQGISCASTLVDLTGGAYGDYGTATVDTVTFTEPTELSQRHKIINNWIEGGTHGVALAGADSCVIQGNTFTDTSHRAVIASPVSHRNVITGNLARGQFSCAFLLAFGSRFNAVSDNVAYCTSSVADLNAFRASFGASDNIFSGNYAYGVAGAAFKAFTGAINNSFIANKAEACGVGLELRSLSVDDGYRQNVNTPAMTGNSVQGNHFLGCGDGIRLRSGTTTSTGPTPATTAGISIPLQKCSFNGNIVQGSTGYGVLFVEDTANGISQLTALGNTLANNVSGDWQVPRTTALFSAFMANTGIGMPAVNRLPSVGNAMEWRDGSEALKAFVSSSGAIATAGRRAAGLAGTSTVAIDYIATLGVGNIGLRIDGTGSQTADLQQWTVNSGASATVTPKSRISGKGHFVTNMTTAPADGDLAAGEMALWFDATNGSAKLMVKAKQADGTVRTGSISLT